MQGLNFAVDHNLILIECSATLEECLGVPVREILGAPYVEWFPAICVEGEDALRKVVALGEPIILSDYRIPSLQGGFRANVSIDPLKTEAGNDGARVQIDGMKHCSRPRGMAAESGWSEGGKVAAMLSHGVRNPLNAIKGAVTYLQGRYVDEVELQEFAGIMVEEIFRLEQFISGFLSTSCQSSDPEPIDIHLLLNKVAAYTSLQAQAAGVSIALQCRDVFCVCVDAYQLEQAVLNLVNNALAVLGEGGHILLSSCMMHRSDQHFSVIEVADNGPGMDAARVEELYDPTTVPEPGQDRGFGLFITREVVTSYGGSLEIESAEGEGTLVRLLLPAVQRAVDVQEKP